MARWLTIFAFALFIYATPVPANSMRSAHILSTSYTGLPEEFFSGCFSNSRDCSRFWTPVSSQSAPARIQNESAQKTEHFLKYKHVVLSIDPMRPYQQPPRRDSKIVEVQFHVRQPSSAEEMIALLNHIKEGLSQVHILHQRSSNTTEMNPTRISGPLLSMPVKQPSGWPSVQEITVKAGNRQNLIRTLFDTFSG